MASAAAKAAVRGLSQRISCDDVSLFAHVDASRFHTAESLDALSVLPKDAERLRRRAKCAAKHAD
jgi:hypothetical protein